MCCFSIEPLGGSPTITRPWPHLSLTPTARSARTPPLAPPSSPVPVPRLQRREACRAIAAPEPGGDQSEPVHQAAIVTRWHRVPQKRLPPDARRALAAP